MSNLKGQQTRASFASLLLTELNVSFFRIALKFSTNLQYLKEILMSQQQKDDLSNFNYLDLLLLIQSAHPGV